MPDFRDYAVKVSNPGTTNAESGQMGKFLRHHETEHGREELSFVQP